MTSRFTGMHPCNMDARSGPRVRDKALSTMSYLLTNGFPKDVEFPGVVALVEQSPRLALSVMVLSDLNVGGETSEQLKALKRELPRSIHSEYSELRGKALVGFAVVDTAPLMFSGKAGVISSNHYVYGALVDGTKLLTATMSGHVHKFSSEPTPLNSGLVNRMPAVHNLQLDHIMALNTELVGDRGLSHALN